MIDAHRPYTHGLASDQRYRHSPPSSSNAGWDLRPTAPDGPAIRAVASIIRHGPSAALLAVVVIACAVVWAATKGGI